MNITLKASLILVAAVALLNVLVFALGLHRDFTTGQVIFLGGAIALNVGVIYWALDRQASTRGYIAQLLTALAIGLIAGFMIVVVSWGIMSFVFPNAIDEMKEGAIVHMEQQNTPADEFQRQVTMLENTTPMSQALPGGMGTVFTSLLSGAVIAVFRRRKA